MRGTQVSNAPAFRISLTKLVFIPVTRKTEALRGLWLVSLYPVRTLNCRIERRSRMEFDCTQGALAGVSKAKGFWVPISRTK